MDSQSNFNFNLNTKIEENESQIDFNLITPKCFNNKESIELYMQQLVNFYDNNPKFDYI